ncbi:transmembrane protein, putative [Medicago truncatula]|uniref:Transmembrane protein, putative n=1 Tax=Medicago truncatula TaxID=3880 RepID=G7JIV6_MEDTR|nr:transmembrane protein, putative [Medicago truncatula]
MPSELKNLYIYFLNLNLKDIKDNLEYTLQMDLRIFTFVRFVWFMLKWELLFCFLFLNN